MPSAEHKRLDNSDEVRTFGHGRVDLVQIGGGEVGRLTLAPGWKWSNDVKPLAGTEWCEAPHFQYHAAGTLHIVMADGQEFVGDEPVVVIDFHGASNYARG